MAGLSDQVIKKDKTPLTSSEQLRLILPEKSFNLLPKNIKPMPDYYYPKSFFFHI